MVEDFPTLHSRAQLLIIFLESSKWYLINYFGGYFCFPEPNSFKHNFNFSIEPPVLVKDFQILKDLIAEYPAYDASGIYGPECTNLDRHGSSRQYLIKWDSLHLLINWLSLCNNKNIMDIITSTT